MAAVVGGGMKYIDLPVEPAKTLEQVQSMVINHYRSNHGLCHLFGKITGYEWVSSDTDSVKVSPSGKLR